MLQKLILKVHSLVFKSATWVHGLWFLLLAFWIRFPFFFRDYIDRDESTFILLAQSLVEGNLPYTELWDLKPPLLFALFAIPISLFGKSLIAIRFMGVIAVSGIALSTCLIGKKVADKGVGFLAGTLTVLLMSLFNSVQGVMSEHLSLLFLMPSLYLLLRNPKPLAYFAAGFGMGLTVLCKTNLVVALAFLCLFLGIKAVRDNKKKELWSVISIPIGGALAVGISYLIYLLEGEGMVWWESVMRAPMAYAGDQSGFPWKYLPFYLGSALLLRYAWTLRSSFGIGFEIAVVALAGIVLTFLAGGKLNGHYLLQFYPLFLLVFLSLLQLKRPVVNRIWIGCIPLLILLLPVESYLEYYRILKNKDMTGTYFNGEGITVPQYINAAYPGVSKILFLEYHIGYWFLDQKPPTRAATHPSNICRPSLFPFMNEGRTTSMEELKYLFEDYRPELVVIRHNKPAFDKKHPKESAYVERYLEEFYIRDTLIEKAVVYRR
jgi:4-amino-4-deoxy-L-arabinose transferase-like glycosyltransferase